MCFIADIKIINNSPKFVYFKISHSFDSLGQTDWRGDPTISLCFKLKQIETFNEFNITITVKLSHSKADRLSNI